MARGCITGWREVGKGPVHRPVADDADMQAKWDQVFVNIDAERCKTCSKVLCSCK